MKKFLVLLCAVLLSFSNVIAQGNRSNYWSPDASMFPNNMTLIGVLQIDGEEQTDTNLEVGAFCGDEVRGSARLTYQSNVNRYMFYITLYGNTGDKISFKLYDHSTNEVSELVCSTTIDFVVDEIVGGLMSPQVLNFAEITSYWIPDPYTYPNNMTVIAVVNIDGVEQTSTNIELGAFCGDEVRGSVKAQYIPSPINKYEYFIIIYGEANDIITFRLYDHDAGEEMAVATTDNITFVINGTEGSIPAPHAINFIASKKVTAVANPAEGGVVTGGGVYNAGETVTLTATPNEGYLFINWTENGEIVATESTYSFVAEETSSSNRTFVANFGLFTAPENLTAIAENATTISLTWDAVATALSYNVYRNGNLVDNVTTNSYTDEDLNSYTEYCYAVSAVHGAMETEQSEPACVTTPDLPITVPTNVVATPISSSAISLTWGAVENALSYNVYRGGELLTNVAEATYTDEGLDYYTEYCYTVSAVRNVTETAQTESVCATTLDLPITTPTNLTAVAESTSTIVLTWGADENALSYNVYRGGELLTNVTEATYTDEGLDSYTEYCYTVSAVRNETETEQSASVCVKTLDLPVTIPTGLTATVESASAITLAWDAVENALSYNVYRDGDFLVNVTATTYADTELSSYTEYCYTVSSVRNETESAQTESVCATTLDLPITMPTNVVATPINSSTISLTWTAVANAMSYKVYRDGEYLNTVTTNSFTNTGLEHLTEYCYTVSAVRNVTETAQTESVCATTLDLEITVPTNLTAVAESTSTMVLTWGAVENALSYNVYRGGELLTNVTEATYTDEGLDYYTEYCYTVSAVRNETETEQSASVCATTLDLPVTTPTGLTATVESASAITLAWTAVENALSYNVYRDGDFLVNVTATTHADTELSSYTEYCYTVSAVRNETESAQTESVCATTLDLEITVPTNLAAVAESASTIVLAWDAVENALSYNVYRGGELLTNVTSATYTDEGLQHLTEYCYTVSAVRNVTETAQTESVCATTLDLPITVPTNLTAVAESTSTIVLTWDAVENALSYNVYRGGELLTNVTEATYTDEGLDYYTEYCYTVSAVRNEVETAQTESVCATTLDLPVTTPTGLTATVESESAITLTWDAVENALSYNVYRDGEFLVNVTATTHADTDLSSYTEYCYTVSAVRNETESAQTESVCATTLDLEITVPTNLTAEAESASTIVLAWDAVENALSYNVYRGGELLTNVTEAAYTDEGLESLTEYCYTVSAVRNVTETAQTESVCATTFDLPITAPTNLAATLEGERMIILTWDAVENAYSYNVYRNGEFLTNVELLSCSDEGLEYETEYCYTVTAVRNETESEHSDEVCVTTLPDGISENEMAFEFYPNPVDEVLIINTDREIEEISVYNISGSMIYQSDVIESTTLNVSAYDEGTYLLRVKIDDKYITRTFIKK